MTKQGTELFAFSYQTDVNLKVTDWKENMKEEPVPELFNRLYSRSYEINPFLINKNNLDIFSVCGLHLCFLFDIVDIISMSIGHSSFICIFKLLEKLLIIILSKFIRCTMYLYHSDIHLPA